MLDSIPERFAIAVRVVGWRGVCSRACMHRSSHFVAQWVTLGAETQRPFGEG